MRPFLLGIALVLCANLASADNGTGLKLVAHTAAQDSVSHLKYYTASLTTSVDSICVVKHLRELYVFHQGQLQKIYRIALGSAPMGHKHFQGDDRTPEGCYFINGKNPYSSCHKNLGISYPNPADCAYAKRFGLGAGGDIKIHGLPNGQGAVGAAHVMKDWTNGCVGVTDEEIDELFRFTEVGVPVVILP